MAPFLGAAVGAALGHALVLRFCSIYQYRGRAYPHPTFYFQSFPSGLVDLPKPGAVDGHAERRQWHSHFMQPLPGCFGP